MRIMFAVLCLIAAVVVTLLLNGQTFTNSIIAVVLSFISIGLGVSNLTATDRQRRNPLFAGAVVTLAFTWCVILLAQLPKAHRFQKNFNESMLQLREKNPE